MRILVTSASGVNGNGFPTGSFAGAVVQLTRLNWQALVLIP
jgi:hypothetical protein